MPSIQSKEIANKSIEFVKDFFSKLSDTEKATFPPVLKENRIWFANYDDLLIGIFYITEEQQREIKNNLNHGLPAFPGLFISNNSNIRNLPVVIKAKGSCNYFESNITTNIIAFDIFPEASLTIQDHLHIIKETSSQEIKYKVDLAFLLGKEKNEKWKKFEIRLLELLQFNLYVWKKMQ